jgi:threonine/homoserine/homoserine lactone efflux protein
VVRARGSGPSPVAVGLVWLTTFAWLVSRMHAVIVRPRVKASLDRFTRVVLMALGLRVALEKR